MEQLVYSVEDAMRILDISKPYLYRLMQNNEIRSLKVGKRRKFRPEHLTEYVDKQEKKVS